MKPWHEHFPRWSDPVVPPPALASVLDEGPRDEAELAFARFVDELPKVEVHVHAEAAVPSRFYASLRGDAAPPAPKGALADFQGFGERWMENLAAIRRPSDYRALARAFVEDRAARRIVHSECHLSLLDTSLYRARFAPGLPVLDLRESLTAFVEGLREAEGAAPDVRVRVILDLVYLAGQNELDQTYQLLRSFVATALNRDAEGERVVVGVGLGGPERPGRAAFFAAALPRFRALGLKLDLHSGEQPHVTPADHRRALLTLRPDRVGHGMRGAPAGVFFEGALAACPISNVLLGGHPGPLAEHPIGEMVRRGLCVSVNTDDPLLFGTNLVVEYVALRRAFGYEQDFVRLTQDNARRQLFSPIRTSPRA